jgi:transposase-like protein
LLNVQHHHWDDRKNRFFRVSLADTLTLIYLGIDAALYRTLRTTNSIENLNGLIAHYTGNVKRWRDGEMVLRWVGTALHEARRGFQLCAATAA